MLKVTETVELSLGDGCTLEVLEAAIAERLKEVGQALFLAACAAVEVSVLEEQSTLQLNKRRPRDLLTRFGWVRLERWSARERATGQYRCPLDEALVMEPRQHASPWVVGQAVALSERMSYRDATDILTQLLGTNVDHRTLWAWVQDAVRSDTADHPRSRRLGAGRPETPDTDPEQPASDEQVVTANGHGTNGKNGHGTNGANGHDIGASKGHNGNVLTGMHASATVPTTS